MCYEGIPSSKILEISFISCNNNNLVWTNLLSFGIVLGLSVCILLKIGCAKVVCATFIEKQHILLSKEMLDAKTHMKKSKKDVQIEAVKAIFFGDLLLEDAMKKYGVKDKRTIVSWMKAFSPLFRDNEYSRNTISEETAQTPSVNEYIVKENQLLKRVIILQDQLRELEEKNAQIQAHRNLLMDKVARLELKLQARESSEVTSDA